MKALTFDGSVVAVSERDLPRPGEGEVLLRPTVAGVCNTDLEIVKGYMGFTGTLGHEVVAVVEEGPSSWKGKRVCCEINFACGRCRWCHEGLGRHCPHRTVLGIQAQDGAFAERVVAPLANLHAVPEAVSDDQAVFVEPLAAAFEILEQVHVRPGTEVTVLGDGKLGMLIALVLAKAGARVLAVGRHDDHLAILRERGIATVRDDAWDRTAKPLVVEATGTAEGLALAMGATLPRGTLVLKSTVADDHGVDLAPLVIHEITVVGSRCGPFGAALDALADGSVKVEPLIAARYELAEGVAALDRARQRGTLKVILDF